MQSFVPAPVRMFSAEQANLNITYQGANGDLFDPIRANATDAEIMAWATEALRNGSVPGIAADPSASLNDFMVDRYAPTEATPFHKIFIRPKTAYGSL